MIYLAFWENPSTFKMVHIFNSNKRKKYKEVEKYSDRVLILNVEGNPRNPDAVSL